MDVDGRVAIVTGAAGGIGSALAARLLERGARVLMTDRDAAGLETALTALEAYGDVRVAGMAGDCASESVIRALVALATRELGPVDLYFANAGVGLAGELATEEDWTRAIEVNLLAHVRAARVLLPQWLERGSGYFVSTASAAGLLTQIGSPTYTVSKHAAVAFSEWLAITYGDRGVGVSCVCPMGVNTPMLRNGAGTGGDARRVARAVTDAGAVLEPMEVADRTLYAVAEGRFLVLPHDEVREMARRKGDDRERWIAGMRRYQRSLDA